MAGVGHYVTLVMGSPWSHLMIVLTMLVHSVTSNDAGDADCDQTDGCCCVHRALTSCLPVNTLQCHWQQQLVKEQVKNYVQDIELQVRQCELRVGVSTSD